MISTYGHVMCFKTLREVSRPANVPVDRPHPPGALLELARRAQNAEHSDKVTISPRPMPSYAVLRLVSPVRRRMRWWQRMRPRQRRRPGEEVGPLRRERGGVNAPHRARPIAAECAPQLAQLALPPVRAVVAPVAPAPSWLIAEQKDGHVITYIMLINIIYEYYVVVTSTPEYI